MRKIPILTPQNVMIDVEGAGVMLRGVAFIIDVIVKIIFFIFLIFLLNLMNIRGDAELIFIYLLVIPAVFLYTLLFEMFMHGQTPGKMMVGIWVRKTDGSEAGPNEILTRWFMRVLDVYISIGALAALMVSATEKEQRLGDMLSGCVVVKKKGNTGIQLDAIEELQKNTEYEPAYPQVINLKEDDVLLMKNAVLRYEKYQNAAHGEAMRELTNHLIKILGIREKPKSPVRFVRTLIKDYIMITR